MQASQGLPTTGAGHVVLDIPFWLPEYRGRGLGAHPSFRRRLVPILVVTNGVQTELVIDALIWAQNAIYLRTYDAVRAGVAAIGRLFAFRMLFPDFVIEDHHDFDLLVWGYLHARLTVPAAIGDRLMPNWNRVSIETAMIEFGQIKEFAKSAAYIRESPVFGQALRVDSRLFSAMPRRKPKDYFFKHLKTEHERFLKLVGEDTGFPADLKYLSRRAARRAKRKIVQLTTDEVRAIIAAEKNVMFKAIWLLLAWTGPRVSEVLHLWVCDILPNTAARFFDFESVFLVIFAHPEGSTYTGSLGAGSNNESRVQHLAKYGRRPRTEKEVGKEQIGSKGMLIFDDEKIISWATWIDIEGAAEFARLVREITDIHIRTGSSQISPYFFVNSKDGDYLGHPMKIGNLEKAFERACERAGVRIGRKRPSLHSFRHHYIWFARNQLKIKPTNLQLMTRHGNVQSQEHYGRRAADLNKTLQTVLTRAV